MSDFTSSFVDQITSETTTDLATYIRDANLQPDVFARYKRGLVIQETGNFDATRIEAGMKCGVRYNIYSSQGQDVKPSFAQYRCVTFERGCYFKVLDIHKIGHRGLVTLLHIPAHAVPYFARHKHAAEEGIVADSRTRFAAIQGDKPEDVLTDPYWIKRTAFPLGITSDGGYFYQFDYGKDQSLNPLYEPKGFFRRLFRRSRW